MEKYRPWIREYWSGCRETLPRAFLLTMTNVKQQTKEKGFMVIPFLEKGVHGELKGVHGETLKGSKVSYHTLTIQQLYSEEGWRR